MNEGGVSTESVGKTFHLQQPDSGPFSPALAGHSPALGLELARLRGNNTPARKTQQNVVGAIHWCTVLRNVNFIHADSSRGQNKISMQNIFVRIRFVWLYVLGKKVK